MNRVVVSREFCGLIGMQVCAVADATDEEILEVCNRENPSGTSNGWGSVIRAPVDGDMWRREDTKPVACSEYPERLHFMVLC